MTFEVPGEPIPKGSWRLRNGRFVPDNARLRAWEQAVSLLSASRMRQMRWEPLTGPVRVTLRFGLERPATVKRERPCVKPDLDKLIRAVLDALTGIAFRDDGQVTAITATKSYAPTPLTAIEILPDI